MQELLTERRTEPREMDGMPKFSATITIQKADLVTTQSFLWTLMQKATQEQARFQEMVEQQSIKRSIGANRFDSHFAIVSQAFSLFGAEPNEKTKALTGYFLAYLPQHLAVLAEATGYDTLTLKQKQEIGSGLYSFFESGAILSKHWHSCLGREWFLDPRHLDTVLDWFKDRDAISHLGKRDLEWVNHMLEQGVQYRALLMEIMRTVARLWLECPYEDIQRLYNYLVHFKRLGCLSKYYLNIVRKTC